MTIYLKCYYGYKNLGDELLFFGVLERLIDHYHPTHITVEVGDLSRRASRLDRHSSLLNTQTTLHAVTINHYKTINADLYVFGGGEVMTDTLRLDRASISHRSHYPLYIGHQLFTRAGRNYLIKYRRQIWSGKVIRLGGLGTPHKPTTQLLYRLTLPYARDIVCRDRYSRQLARRYYSKSQSYKDRSLDILNQIPIGSSGLSGQYVLINCSYSQPSKHKIDKILQRLSQHPNSIPVYIPMDRHHDMTGFLTLKDHIHNLQLYDRTTNTLSQICSLFGHAEAGVGERLHFLLLLQYYGRPYTILTPSEKITHVINP